ncbi:hypothetical protein H5407_08190 [Mitsuaria sp. WAJ17]|uniref:hypothetical protein n=1 Tax=unclassified Roseateles TaxID=2626991 RepID=UPI0016016E0A|nr:MULTISPECIES: hypothetical protein [unclassified Roseateles]MBB2485211.1 hypothetical protein [Mitsuaria sp. WAJ17]
MSKKLKLSTTSVRQLGANELTDVAGGYTSIAACGDDPTNRPCMTINAASGCPTGVPETQTCPPATGACATSACPPVSRTPRCGGGASYLC